MSTSAETRRLAVSRELVRWRPAPDTAEREHQPHRAPAAVTLVTDAESRTTAWISMLEASVLLTPAQVAYCHVWKRAFDIVVASLMLVVFAPLLVLCALVIRLDSRGPAIFRQRRVGRGGATFQLYKFRTMRHAPGEEFQLFRAGNGELRHKIQDDPRITRLGRFIRRTSIDELPQLINVLRGEMSLIGPRPELPQIVGGYEQWQHRRHLVRPGLTGWWQVQGRSDRPMHEHTDLDLYYVENMSWRLDLHILRRTAVIVAKGLGAF